MRDHTPEALRNAKRLRAEMSLPEVLRWRQLRKRPLGVKFRRQHPIGNFIVDFCCVEWKVVIEIDGKAHDMGDRPDRDERRDEWLRMQGFNVVRLPAEHVLRDLAAVAGSLVALCTETPPPSVADATATSPGGGGLLEGIG